MASTRVRYRSRGSAMNDVLPSSHGPGRSGFSRDGAFLELLETVLLACAVHRERAIAAEAAPTGAGARCGSSTPGARRILPAMHTGNAYAC